jgi:hypothetical protein
MSRWILIALIAAIVANPSAAQAPEEPQPPVVEPGAPDRPPSDAIVLFNGRDMSGWIVGENQPAPCQIEQQVMACSSGTGNIYTTRTFDSAQIHLEFAVPPMPNQTGQLGGNSGVYIQGKYEIQILDSYRSPTYPNGMLGALYGQSAPLVNAAKPPGEWQTYDIVFHAPRCINGKIAENGTVTVFLNGILVQDDVTIADPTGSCGPGPLLLQDHSGFPGAPMTTMRFRNIWLRPIPERPAAIRDAGVRRPSGPVGSQP